MQEEHILGSQEEGEEIPCWARQTSVDHRGMAVCLLRSLNIKGYCGILDMDGYKYLAIFIIVFSVV